MIKVVRVQILLYICLCIQYTVQCAHTFRIVMVTSSGGENFPFKTELEITPNNLHVTFSLLFISCTHVEISIIYLMCVYTCLVAEEEVDVCVLPP